MFKAASWALVVGAFCVLSGYKSHVPDVAVNHIQGIQATKHQKLNPHQVELISVIGTVVTTVVNDKGQTNVKLEADDGTPLTVTIPPTVNVRVPRVGARIQVEGQVIMPGVVSIPNHWNLKVLAPSYKKNSREIIQGDINYLSESYKGILANISHDETYVETVFIPSSVEFDRNRFGSHIAVTGYRQANGRIYVEEIL